jgi:hypothetical protein
MRGHTHAIYFLTDFVFLNLQVNIIEDINRFVLPINDLTRDDALQRMDMITQ